MIKRISLLSSFLVFALFLNCKKETATSKLEYTQKANELIQQVILDDPCDCILEIPKESSIKSSLADNPLYDVRKKAIKELHLKNRTELDSLENLGQNFILNTSFLKQRHIKVIERKYLRERMKDTLFFQICKNGFLSISKPIFDKNYTTAILYSSYGPTCIGMYPVIYRYKNGTWKAK